MTNVAARQLYEKSAKY